MTTLQNEYNTSLYHASSALHRWLGRIANENFQAVELTPTQGFILITLKQAPGITVSGLADVHQLDQSTITRTLDRMKEKGLIFREGEGKSVQVFVTGKGEKKEADAKAAWKKMDLAIGRIIGNPEAKNMASLITKALGKLKNP
jgi:DNA-binding MarR family transcriptional regulator